MCSALCGPIVGGYLYETIGFTPTVASIAAALGLLMLWATSMLRSMQAYGDDSASDSDGKSSGMCGLLRIPSVASECCGLPTRDFKHRPKATAQKGNPKGNRQRAADQQGASLA